MKTGNKTMDVTDVYKNIKEIIETARIHTYRFVNFTMVKTYWEIGQKIVEEEQKGTKRAEYGDYLIPELANKLTMDFGSGFNETNLRFMRRFYSYFPIQYTLCTELTWSHYRLLIRIENLNILNFYMHEAANSSWSVRELERQINSHLYERLLMSKNKDKVKEMSQKGQIIRTPEDLIKDPYILEFMNLKENKDFHEKDMEGILIEKLKNFLLELGKGFSFVARQKRISVEGDNFYIDLVFYNYILKCFVLIDLKTSKLTHQDIGQMDFYVRYFEKEIKTENDNETVGIILCSDKNETMVKYTLLNNNKTLFASKYKLYLPTEDELKKELEREREFVEREKLEVKV